MNRMVLESDCADVSLMKWALQKNRLTVRLKQLALLSRFWLSWTGDAHPLRLLSG
jgi:hypothetical protein